MDQNAAIEAVRFFGERLTQQAVRISQLILFGSHARGAASEESDVDVLVVSDDFRDKDIFERARLIAGPERATIRRYQVPLDVILMTPEEFNSGASLLAQAARTGMVLLAGANASEISTVSRG
ncbi:MAG: nucleotidyltransferase domain-containing protein [Candidatus Brocadiia bacterium]|jgi:predicted nucleotidyltransferase